MDEEGLPIYHGQSHPRNNALGYYNNNLPTHEFQRSHSQSQLSQPPTAQPPSQTSQPPPMSFYPSSVQSSELYARQDPYAPSAHYGAHHVSRPAASTPSSPYYYPADHNIHPDPPSPAPIRKAAGFRRVRDARDLRPSLQASFPAVSKLTII